MGLCEVVSDVKFQNKREKGRAMLFYAQSLYCIGRVDLACSVVEKSLKHLKGEKEYKQACDLAAYYRKLVNFSKTNNFFTL